MEKIIVQYAFKAGICLFGIFLPVKMLVVSLLVFILIDFFTGNVADFKRKKAVGEKYAFESKKGWKTLNKIIFSVIGVYLSWMIDEHMLHFVELHLPELLCAFICGVELWSILENASEISNHPVFRWAKRFMKEKIKEKAGVDFEKPESK